MMGTYIPGTVRDADGDVTRLVPSVLHVSRESRGCIPLSLALFGRVVPSVAKGTGREGFGLPLGPCAV